MQFHCLLLFLSSTSTVVRAFTLPTPEVSYAVHETLQNFPQVSSLLSVIPDPTATDQLVANSNLGASLFAQYQDVLETYPLTTKMVTGGLVAVGGDYIGQVANSDGKKLVDYDKLRAVSFVIFDMAYRALQHWAFPAITAVCHGQYATAALSTIGLPESWLSDQTIILAATEQTLVNQLGIVPFIYYPVFFTLTAAIQGLSASDGLKRAKNIFIPLMKRNLLFWVPIQFIQFRWIEESLQVPFVIVAGLVWTVILSVVAGSAKQGAEDAPAQGATFVADQSTQMAFDQANAAASSESEQETKIPGKDTARV